MKTAIYIEDGTTQLVLTPESNFEKEAIEKINREKLDVTINKGSFYLCQGGWNRHGENDNSLMIRICKENKN